MIARHTMTVVAADGEYVKPFTVTAALLSPGQTTDVLVTADQPKGNNFTTHWSLIFSNFTRPFVALSLFIWLFCLGHQYFLFHFLCIFGDGV